MKLKHLSMAVAAALGLSTAAVAQTGDTTKRAPQQQTETGTAARDRAATPGSMAPSDANRSTPMSSQSSAGGMAAGSEDVREIQQELQSRGFNPGPVDGIMGPQTKNALRSFQEKEGMPATGELDSKTKSTLGVDATPGSGSSSATPASGSGTPSGTTPGTGAASGTTPGTGAASGTTPGTGRPSSGMSSPSTGSSASPESSTSPDPKATSNPGKTGVGDSKDKSTKGTQNPKP